jgi:hypothetical protein
MARSKKQHTGGPYLAAAVFCENVIQGADGALSAIRIVDRLTILISADAPEDVPSENKRLTASLWALLSFKTGYSTGSHEVGLVLHSPSGKKQPLEKHQLTLSSEPHGGGNLKINMVIAIKQGGLFWIDVVLDGVVVTRMPLQINVERVQKPGQPPSKLDSTIKKRRKRAS